MDKNEWMALNAISICRNLIGGFFYVFIPIYMLSAHLALSDIGLAIGFATLARLLTAPFIGTLNDLLGTRRLIQLSLIGMSIGAACIGLLPSTTLSLATLLLPLVLFWVSNNALILSLEVSLYKKSSPEKMAGHVGDYNALKALAWGGGILASGLLLLAFPFASISLGLSAFALLALALTLHIQHTVKVEFNFSQYVHELHKPQVLVLCLLIFIMAYEWGTEGVALPPIYSQQAGMDTGGIGMVSFVANAAYAASAFLVGRHFTARRTHVQSRLVWHALTAGMLICAMASIFLFLSHDISGAMLSRSLSNIGEAVISLCFGFLIGTTFSSARVGGANGMLNLIGNTGQMAAAFAAGALMGFGVSVPYLVAGSLFLVGAALSVWGGRDNGAFRHAVPS